MRVKTIMVAFVVAVLPGLALAGGTCGTGDHGKSASVCVDGQIWDDATQLCVGQFTG